MKQLLPRLSRLGTTLAGVIFIGQLILNPAPVFADGGTRVTACLSTQSVAADGTFDLDVVLNTDLGTRGAQGSLAFDPNVLQVVSVAEGTFFSSWAKANGAQSLKFPNPKTDNNAGTVSDIGVAIVGGTNYVGPIGTGILWVYHMKAKPNASGQSALTIKNVKVISADAQTIGSTTVSNGSVTIGAAGGADPNPDCQTALNQPASYVPTSATAIPTPLPTMRPADVLSTVAAGGVAPTQAPLNATAMPGPVSTPAAITPAQQVPPAAVAAPAAAPAATTAPQAAPAAALPPAAPAATAAPQAAPAAVPTAAPPASDAAAAPAAATSTPAVAPVVGKPAVGPSNATTATPSARRPPPTAALGPLGGRRRVPWEALGGLWGAVVVGGIVGLALSRKAYVDVSQGRTDEQ